MPFIWFRCCQDIPWQTPEDETVRCVARVCDEDVRSVIAREAPSGPGRGTDLRPPPSSRRPLHFPGAVQQSRLAWSAPASAPRPPWRHPAPWRWVPGRLAAGCTTAAPSGDLLPARSRQAGSDTGGSLLSARGRW